MSPANTAMKPAFAGFFFLIFALTASVAQQAPANRPAPAAPDQDATQLAFGKDTAQAGPAQAPTPPDYSQEAYVVEHFRAIDAL